jgi:hypothetical protein
MRGRLDRPVLRQPVLPRRSRPVADRIPTEVWYRVQTLLAAHNSAGDRRPRHDHYLKGSVYCGACGSRLMISNARSARGPIYPYLHECLALAGDCHSVYACGSDTTRRMANQAFFTRIYLDADDQITTEPTPSYRLLLDPAVQKRALTWASLHQNGKKRPTRTLASQDEGSSKTHQVEVAGVEPASFSTSPGLLRAQPALHFSAPAVMQASRRAGSAAVWCPA